MANATLPPVFCNLEGCINKYSAGTAGIKNALDTHVLFPWVEVSIVDGTNTVIAVGNNSSKTAMAVVKSFQFGVSNGSGVNIEVVDEAGGQFSRFFKLITTGNVESPDKWKLKFKWGWAPQSCLGSNQPSNTQPIMSPEHTMVVKGITCNVQQGLFKYNIEGNDLTIDLFSSRDDNVFGSDGQPIRLVRAISELLEKYGITPLFKKINADGSYGALEIKDVSGNPGANVAGALGGGGAFASAGGKLATGQGPPATWASLNRNPIQIARDWLNHVVSKRGKGIVTYWDTTAETPTIIFLESNKPSCETNLDTAPFNLGTYVVNGGQCSPVLSFTPHLQWDYATAMVNSGGWSGDALAAKMNRTDGQNSGPEPCLQGKTPNLNNAGVQKGQVVTPMAASWWWGQAIENLNANTMTNINANKISRAIEAELRIQGDPTFSDPKLLNGFYVGIVYINPFVVSGTAEEGCIWMVTEPPCNNILSNSNWMIHGGFHEIREGSYTTTLRLWLAAPGLDVARTVPLGAAANGAILPQ